MTSENRKATADGRHLVEALGPGHGDAVAARRRDEAGGRLATRGAVALAVVVHLAAEAGASAWVLAGEEVNLRGGARRHRRGATGAGNGERVPAPAAGREDEREEDDHGEEEDRPDDIEERPLPAAGEGAAPAVRRQGAEEPHWGAESAASVRARSDQAIRVLISRVFLWSGCVGFRCFRGMNIAWIGNVCQVTRNWEWDRLFFVMFNPHD